MSLKPVLILSISALFFLIPLVTGPPSFDATDGAELAVCGSYMQIAHSPGYPLFLLLVRLVSLVFSPLYGHLRLLNCIISPLIAISAMTMYRKNGAGASAAALSGILLVTSAPIMSQLNCLEVYPLALLLSLVAILQRKTSLGPYAMGMAVFAGHPAALLATPLMFTRNQFRGMTPIFLLIPATLMLYIPLRAQACSIAHYGHPVTMSGIADYLMMHSGRISLPSLQRLWVALSSQGFFPLLLFLLLSALGGKLRLSQDLSILLALLFLSSYALPDPEGQMWILLLPLSIRFSRGIQRLITTGVLMKTVVIALVVVSSVHGIASSSRTEDDIALRWTSDVMSSLPTGSIYRPVAHDAFYSAYAWHTLEFRNDIILSDPFGNFFELVIPPPVPPVIGGRTVHVSRAWDRVGTFRLSGLVFHPENSTDRAVNWEEFDIFRFSGSSPDPMAMDLAAEAWSRRMIQEKDTVMADSCYRRAMDLAATETTRSRIENLRVWH